MTTTSLEHSEIRCRNTNDFPVLVGAEKLKYTRYCQGTKLNTQDTLKSISKEIGFFYFDLKSELSRQRLKFKSKDGN